MTPEPPATLAQALRTVLALPPADQLRLCTLLQRLVAVDHDAQADPVADTALATQHREASPESAQDWLQRIAQEPPWARLQLLNDALLACGDDDHDENERAVLQAALAQLLRTHPPLALRHAVTVFATAHPAGVAIAVVGLLLGAAGAARLLLRLLF